MAGEHRRCGRPRRFTPSRHNDVGVQLDEEGRYKAVVPLGEVQVGIDNRHLLPRQNLGRTPRLACRSRPSCAGP